MTKYILQSGSLGNARDKGKAFYNEVIEGLGKNPRILYCLFALPRERWDKFFVYKEGFRGQISDDIKPDFELAMPETFEEQIKNCDVVMIQGGDDHLLQYWLRQFDIPKIWKGRLLSAVLPARMRSRTPSGQPIGGNVWMALELCRLSLFRTISQAMGQMIHEASSIGTKPTKNWKTMATNHCLFML